MADQDGSLADQPAIEDSALQPEPKQANKKKKKKKKEAKAAADSDGEQGGPSDKDSDKRRKGADSGGSEAEPKPAAPKKKKKSPGSEGEPWVEKKKKKSGKKAKRPPPASDKEIAIEDPPPEPEEHLKSESIKTPQSGKSQKEKESKKKKKGKKKSKKDLAASTDPTDREKGKEPVEATAAQHTDKTQQDKQKGVEEPTPKRKERSVSKEETIYNEKDGDKRNDDYDPSETVKRGSGSSGKSDKERPVARIPEPASDKNKAKSSRDAHAAPDNQRGTPTPLTDVTQDHPKPIDPDNLTERLKADIAKREKELERKVKKASKSRETTKTGDTTNSPSSEPKTPRRKAAKEAQKKKGSQEAVKGGVNSTLLIPVERRTKKDGHPPTCTSCRKEKRTKTEAASDKTLNVRAACRAKRRGCPKRAHFDFWHAWPRCRRFSIVVYWLVGGAVAAALIVLVHYTERLPD